MSPRMPMWFNLNRIRMSAMFSKRLRPEYRQSFNEGPLFEHEASNTALILVVSLSLLITSQIVYFVWPLKPKKPFQQYTVSHSLRKFQLYWFKTFSFNQSTFRMLLLYGRKSWSGLNGSLVTYLKPFCSILFSNLQITSGEAIVSISQKFWSSFLSKSSSSGFWSKEHLMEYVSKFKREVPSFKQKE